MWYASTINDLQPGRSCRRADIIATMKRKRHGLSVNSYVWAIGNLVWKGLLQHEGRNCYALPDGEKKAAYTPYTEEALMVMNQVERKYPLIGFTVICLEALEWREQKQMMP